MNVYDHTCEVCGRRAVAAVVDCVELEPMVQAEGPAWRNFQSLGMHSFCTHHDRGSRQYCRDGRIMEDRASEAGPARLVGYWHPATDQPGCEPRPTPAPTPAGTQGAWL